MALSPEKLTGELLRLPPQRAHLAGPAWAAAYRRYAEDARSCQARPPSTVALDAAEVKLGAAAAALYASSRALPQTARGLALALAAFWLLPPVPFLGGASPGVVTAAVPATLEAALLAVWAPPGGRQPEAARRLARALHLWTTTNVVVAHGPVPACFAALV